MQKIDGQSQLKNLAMAVFCSAKSDYLTQAGQYAQLLQPDKKIEWMRNYAKHFLPGILAFRKRTWCGDRTRRLGVVYANRRQAIAEFQQRLKAGGVTKGEAVVARATIHRTYKPQIDAIKAERYPNLTPSQRKVFVMQAYERKLHHLEKEQAIITDLYAGPSLWSDILGVVPPMPKRETSRVG